MIPAKNILLDFYQFILSFFVVMRGHRIHPFLLNISAFNLDLFIQHTHYPPQAAFPL